VKITSQKLKQIIQEELARALTENPMQQTRPHHRGSEGYEMTAQSGVDAKMFDAVIDALELKPGINGAELVDAVNQVHQGIGDDVLYDFLDELIEDGEVFFDTAEDAWYIANSQEAIAAMDAQDQFSSREANPHDGGMYGEDRY
jgi:hypothetical protein